MSTTKVPAAVVYLERPDGRVLALTRGHDFGDWHLPGGKWEPKLDHAALPRWVGEPDAEWYRRGGPDLAATAIREVWEETGVRLHREHLRPLADYVTRSGRPVLAFLAGYHPWIPERFGVHPAGQPAWVPPGMLTMPWCSFAPEVQHVLEAVARDRAGGGP